MTTNFVSLQIVNPLIYTEQQSSGEMKQYVTGLFSNTTFQKMISQKELLNKVQPLMAAKGIKYKKSQNVFARQAVEGESISTVTADGAETVNRAKSGDFIVMNQTGAGEMYILTPQKFNDRYALLKNNEGGFSEYYPTGKITALELTDNVLTSLGFPEVFHFEAPWGEAMIAKKDDYLACPPNGEEVYRIARKEFFETYKKDEA